MAKITARFAHRILQSAIVRSMYRKYFFPGSGAYWEARYARGGNSGTGSFGVLARFKSAVINEFVRDRSVNSVIEFGCGDGSQLSLANYPKYLGLDISKTAVQLCNDRFERDDTKQFLHYEPTLYEAGVLTAELALSLDVLYHLVEDEVYEIYMSHLFNSATRFVIVYSSDNDGGRTASHVKHRCFTDWIKQRAPQWTLMRKIPSNYPFDAQRPRATSYADFFVFEKK